MADVSVFARRRVVEESSDMIGDVVAFTSSTAAGGSCVQLVQNRPPDYVWNSRCFRGSFVEFDFQSDPVVISGYTLAFPRLIKAPLFNPRAILIEASNDAQTWVTLHRRAFEKPVDTASGVVPAECRCVSRFVRISQPGPNFSDTDTFALAELDLRSLVYTVFEK
jgi:hypothetical protein